MVSIRKKPDAAMLLAHAPTPIHLIAALVGTSHCRPAGGPAG
jgi:hypothetical protein